MDRQIPDKLFFRIGEVSKIADIEPYVLRYWESEFWQLRPVKNKSGQRIYKKKDVEIVLEIKRLLYEELYTIPGAKKRLNIRTKHTNEQLSFEFNRDNMIKIIDNLKKSLRSILVILDEK